MLVLWLTFAPSVLEFEHLKIVIKYNQIAIIQHILGGASWDFLSMEHHALKNLNSC
jgi:hypothetical protein